MNPNLKPLFLFSILLFASISMFAQKNDYHIENIMMSFIDMQLKIDFDLIGKHKDQSQKVNLFFIDEGLRVYKPTSIQPETDHLFQPGKGKTILWNMTEDVKRLEKTYTPILIPGDPAKYHFGPGPEVALLSLLIPGLGDYALGQTKNERIKPIIRTLGAFGFIAIGGYASRERYRGEPSYTDHGTMWSSGTWNYKFFRNDAELLIGTGVAIWVADIIWVAIRGQKNKTLKKSLNSMIIVL